MSSKLSNFKFRRIVHYSLLFCILLIQILIAGFFYNEFNNKKSLSFIEKQIEDFRNVEDLTQHSRKDLLSAQNYFQKYLVTENDDYLALYLTALKSLDKNLSEINILSDKNPQLKESLNFNKNDSLVVQKLKVMIDSSSIISTKTNADHLKLPDLKKYNYNFDFSKYKVETKTYTDTIQKKGIFGRIKDAISGKETVRKDSTVVIVKQGENDQLDHIKTELDSVINVVNNHYIEQIKKTEINVFKNQSDIQTHNKNLNKIYGNLLLYSNGLLNVYEVAISDSKIKMEKEYLLQNSTYNKIRKNLVLGLMFLMFLVSILIMYLTRISFIYERKLSEANLQIKENLNFKNRILGMLSHELRSPLKIIDLFIKKINNKTEDLQVKDYLKSISFTNNTLLMQANQILEYTKNQQVENKLILVEFNLKEELNAILTSITPYIETRNNQFIINDLIDTDFVVFSDRTKINQIFMNILGNANKFTESGKIKVHLSTEKIDENTIFLLAKISDTGVGISKSDLEKIFEPYYQGILSENIENLGAGLGLSLCKEIIELFSGKITVESEQNRGTTIDFRLNLALKK